MKKIWQDIAIPAMRGFLAFARNQYKQTYLYLKPILQDLQALGASKTHRDIINQILKITLNEEIKDE